MSAKIPDNELYLAVLPVIHLGDAFGLTEQIMTLFPDRAFATEFFPDEVDSYLLTFKNRADKYFTGGHITGYDCVKENTEDGRVIVRVIQRVA